QPSRDRRGGRGEKNGYQFLSQTPPLVKKKAASRGGALMQWRGVARAGGAARHYLSRPLGAFAIVALAASAGGCSSSPSSGKLALASLPASGATVAFESIDGPPPEVFRKLVTSLNDEAGAHKIAVVSRSSTPTY